MTPLFMSRPDQDLIPHNYVVVKQVTHCANCGTTHESCMVTAKTYLHSKMTGRPFANQRPVRSPNEITHNLPIEIENRPPERIPFCHACFATVSLAHLPTPPRQGLGAITGSSLADAPKPKTQKAKQPFTIDDL